MVGAVFFSEKRLLAELAPIPGSDGGGPIGVVDGNERPVLGLLFGVDASPGVGENVLELGGPIDPVMPALFNAPNNSVLCPCIAAGFSEGLFAVEKPEKEEEELVGCWLVEGAVPKLPLDVPKLNPPADAFPPNALPPLNNEVVCPVDVVWPNRGVPDLARVLAVELLDPKRPPELVVAGENENAADFGGSDIAGLRGVSDVACVLPAISKVPCTIVKTFK